MDSTVKKVGDSPASKVIPESSIDENATSMVREGAERVILESPIGESDCNRCEHIEQEFKVLKGSIKKLIVDIREQMNTSENPFLNIQQMMPAQSAIYREDPPEMEKPVKPREEPEAPVQKTETEEPVIKDNAGDSSACNTNGKENYDRCPLANMRDRASPRCAMEGEYGGQTSICPAIQRLFAPGDFGASELCYECIRHGGRLERNANGYSRPGCPANLKATPPCGRLVDRGYGAVFREPALPCMPQYDESRANPAYGQGPCFRCPWHGEPQPRGRTPDDYDYYSPREHEPRGNDYPHYYRNSYAGHERYGQGPAEYHQGYDGSHGYDREWSRSAVPPESAREHGRGRTEPWQRPRAYQPSGSPQDYDGFDEEPEYGYRDASGHNRPAHSHGRSRRRSLEYAYDDGYVQPEPEPVTIDIPTPGSVRKKRKSQARAVPDMVVVDVEPENVVPQSIRASRRKGL